MKYASLIAALTVLVTGSCNRRDTSSTSTGTETDSTIVRVEGSDTMVNLAQAWAEEYNKTDPDISIQVSGGGSGVGIASLIDGVTDMANASRKMKEKELARAEQNTGKEPQEFVVALDALAVYVHKDNPIDSISIEQLAEIYGDGGTITKWSQLEVDNSACASDKITRVSRQNNSGTYHYFREAVLGKRRDYKLGSIDQSGSKDVVALVSRTPCAIGFSGMGYKNDEVKWLKVKTSNEQDGGVEPSVASAADGSYPIARPLLIYTLGEPTGAIKAYLDWILSPAGQKVVLDLGYVPLSK
jgi:phosphate transport system substrate-binding protein